MLGAVAAGPDAGGYASVEQAAAAMAPRPTERYTSDAAAHGRYDTLYAIYTELYDTFGRRSDLMHRLRALR
jgi:L-ribulokinase